MKKIGPDTITAIASIFIAVVAIFISVWQGIQTRKHYRLSVRPNINVRWDVRQDVNRMGIKIDNNGLGPAIIGDIAISVGETKHFVNTKEGMLEVLDTLRINEDWIIHRYHNKGSYLKEGSGSFLFVANRRRMGTDEEVRLRRAMSKVTVHIQFNSIYGDQYEIVEKWK